jgi:hypothetical protein
MKKQGTGDDRNKSEAYGHAYALLTRSKAAMGAAWASWISMLLQDKAHVD